MLLAPLPPETPNPQTGLRPLVRRSNYGSWSSSGQPSLPTAIRIRSSGQSRDEDSSTDEARAVSAMLCEIPHLASDEEITLQTDSLERAFDFLRDFHLQIARLSPNSPHVSFSAEGEIVLEWRQAQKQLVFYIGNDSLSYIKVWGPDIYHQMEEGEVFSTPQILPLWHWLKA